MKNGQSSSFKIIVMGQLMVNLPVTLVIASIWIGSVTLFGTAAWIPSLIAASFAGWITWSKLLDKWKTWALKSGVKPERLFKLGKWGLLNFYRYKIIEEHTE